MAENGILWIYQLQNTNRYKIDWTGNLIFFSAIDCYGSMSILWIFEMAEEEFSGSIKVQNTDRLWD